ncbi:MAG: prolipoprotein diacylglyceryl transferase [Candidatus Omnitrophota bacterium]|nr:MAG: prolipoprotein diacylglyceryl transferase [Candidatus Omnitrophota bacterium]
MHPILFEIGPVTVRTYGVLVACAFFIGFSLLYEEARKQNFYPDKILDLELLILIFGIIGARALHVLVNFDFYRENLPDIFFIWKGGLAFYGGLISAILASTVFILKKKLPFWKTADFVIPYIALGQSIGRIGCFLNGCCFGKPAPFSGHTIYRYPAQLYASLALLCIFVILRLIQKKPLFTGFVFTAYLILYATQRFFIDFLRGDTSRYALNLTVSQIISIVLFAMGIGFIIWHKLGGKRAHAGIKVRS